MAMLTHKRQVIKPRQRSTGNQASTPELVPGPMNQDVIERAVATAAYVLLLTYSGPAES